jgi:hypothetical protein
MNSAVPQTVSRINSLSITALVLGIALPPLAVPVGHVAVIVYAG